MGSPGSASLTGTTGQSFKLWLGRSGETGRPLKRKAGGKGFIAAVATKIGGLAAERRTALHGAEMGSLTHQAMGRGLVSTVVVGGTWKPSSIFSDRWGRIASW